MLIYFSSRDKARSATFGKMVDNGPEAPKGKRFARCIKASGNASQRRKMVRQVVMQVGA